MQKNYRCELMTLTTIARDIKVGTRDIKRGARNVMKEQTGCVVPTSHLSKVLPKVEKCRASTRKCHSTLTGKDKINAESGTQSGPQGGAQDTNSQVDKINGSQGKLQIPHEMAQTPHEMAQTPHEKAQTSHEKSVMASLPPELQDVIRGLTRKTPSEKLKNIILEICSVQPYTVREISEMTNRSQEHLRKDLIPKLVEEGSLKLTFPENPKHKKQAYTTIKGSRKD